MKDRILQFIRTKGPSLPTAIAKEMGIDSLFASAHLSELKEHGKIKISHLKVGGGSPLYYLAGQEDQLQKFAENLGEKEKKIYDLLLGKKVIRDSSLVPVFRAAIRTVKDFASPFQVKLNGKPELFWKWYQLSSDEASAIVRKMLGVKEEQKPKEKETVKPPASEQKKKETQKHLPAEPKPSKPQNEKKQILREPGSFYDELLSYFEKNKIRAIEEKIIRKTEAEFVVEVPSPVGNLHYFVKAKSKKKVNDGDLSSAFIQAQSRRLPVLFLSKGSLTKKAEEMMQTDFKGMKFSTL